MVVGETMSRIEGYVEYKSGQKQKDGGYLYIIGYKKYKKARGGIEIRFIETPWTNVTFRKGHKITIETRDDDSITVMNHTIHGTVTGKKV